MKDIKKKYRLSLVLVRYGNSVDAEIPKAIRDEFDDVHQVWTNLSPGMSLPDPNICFEFSGYQEGLARVISHADRLIKVRDECENIHHCVIFANDTIFSGHLTVTSNFIIKSLIKLGCQKSFDSNVTGLIQNFSGGCFPFCEEGLYFSSWIFMVEASLTKLQRLRFYEEGVNPSYFSAYIQPQLPESYRVRVDSWLQPKSILRGWYQATPGITLPINTLKRKEFAIYLEHGLYDYLKSQGFSITCISKRFGYINLTIFKLLRTLDRVYVNLLKLSNRLCVRVKKIPRI